MAVDDEFGEWATAFRLHERVEFTDIRCPLVIGVEGAPWTPEYPNTPGPHAYQPIPLAALPADLRSAIDEVLMDKLMAEVGEVELVEAVMEGRKKTCAQDEAAYLRKKFRIVRR